MVRSMRVILSLLVSLPLFAANWQELKQEARARRPVWRAAAAGAKALVVDCAKGESVQAAIDKSPSPVEIEIHGVCIESVVIDGKKVTLRGLSPATDGLQSPTTAAAIQILDSSSSRIENLSLSNNPGRALSLERSMLLLNNCTIDGNNAVANTQGAVNIFTQSHVDATAVRASNNVRRVFVVAYNSTLFCDGCEFTDNGGYAAHSTRGSMVSLLNSTVTQRDGIDATIDSYVDIDCVSEAPTHPCSMQATRRAAHVELGGTAVMYHAGDFTGRIEAFDRGGAQIFGARQLAGAQPGQGAPQNRIGRFATFEVYAGFFTDPPVQSRVMSTNVDNFGRMLVTDQSVVSGAIVCNGASDAFLEGTVIVAPGSTVTGCEHASVP